MKTYLFVISEIYYSGSGSGILERNKAYTEDSIIDAWKRSIDDIILPTGDQDAACLQNISIRYLGELDEE